MRNHCQKHVSPINNSVLPVTNLNPSNPRELKVLDKNTILIL